MPLVRRGVHDLRFMAIGVVPSLFDERLPCDVQRVGFSIRNHSRLTAPSDADVRIVQRHREFMRIACIEAGKEIPVGA